MKETIMCHKVGMRCLCHGAIPKEKVIGNYTDTRIFVDLHGDEYMILSYGKKVSSVSVVELQATW